MKRAYVFLGSVSAYCLFTPQGFINCRFFIFDLTKHAACTDYWGNNQEIVLPVRLLNLAWPNVAALGIYGSDARDTGNFDLLAVRGSIQ